MSGKPGNGTPNAADIADDDSAARQAGGEAPETAAASDAAAAETTLAEARALADENWDKYLRAMAELDNVRKRAQRDVENARKYALERFCAELLAVRDSLEMGLTAAEQADAEALRAGKEATLKQLAATMERFGVAEIDPQGEPFDPELHEAMTMQPSESAEPGSVLSVFQKGYTLNGRLLRPARVVVAAAPASASESP
ncbi:MAG: nucleotide exchange factor GrpE [Woeseiaceae bacterium]